MVSNDEDEGVFGNLSGSPINLPVSCHHLFQFSSLLDAQNLQATAMLRGRLLH
jgi:hypothetical protein